MKKLDDLEHNVSNGELLRIAIIGSKEYGVKGLVDRVDRIEKMMAAVVIALIISAIGSIGAPAFVGEVLKAILGG